MIASMCIFDSCQRLISERFDFQIEAQNLMYKGQTLNDREVVSSKWQYFIRW